MSIAKVIVEIALNKEFDYAIPEELEGEIRIGDKVNIPFCHRKAQGYVVGLSDTSDHKKLKNILSRVGDKPPATAMRTEFMKIAMGTAASSKTTLCHTGPR